MFLLSWIPTLISWNFTLISWAFTLISWAFTPLSWAFTLISWTFTPLIDEHASSPSLHGLPVGPRLEVVSPSASGSSKKSTRDNFLRMSRKLRSSKPSACHWIDPEDIERRCQTIIHFRGFAEIWEVTYDDRKVVLKTYFYRKNEEVPHVVAVRPHPGLCEMEHR